MCAFFKYVFLQHLDLPLHGRDQEKVLQVHEGVGDARSSKSRMKSLVVMVDDNSEVVFLVA